MLTPGQNGTTCVRLTTYTSQSNDAQASSHAVMLGLDGFADTAAAAVLMSLHKV